MAGIGVKSIARRTIIAALLAGLTLGACTPPPAAEKPRVIIFTYVSYPILDQSIEGITETLAQNGFSADTIDLRTINAGGQEEVLPAMSAEALASNPDVIVPVSTPVAKSVAGLASPDQAVIYSTVTNPADLQQDQSTRNMSGVADVVNYEANIDLIQTLFPRARRIGMIYNPGERNSQFGVTQTRAIAEREGLTLVTVTANNSTEVLAAVRSLFGRVDVLYIGSDNTVASAMEGVVAAAAERHLPVIASDAGSVEQGALASVSVDYRRLGNRVGEMVVSVLRDRRRPSELPPVAFEGDTLVLNASTAAELGLTFPQALLDRQPRIVR